VNTTEAMGESVECKEKTCFFKESDKYNHVCKYCVRNDKSTSKDDDYHTVIARSGY